MSATLPSPIRVRPRPAPPSSATRGKVPSDVHQLRCAAPRKLPMAKKGNATNATGLPLPALTKVPEPQPRTTCIAMPKTKAPPTMANPMGAWAPINSPEWLANSGKATAATRAMAKSCAKRPDGSRRRIIARHGPAKPNRNPSSVAPRPRPISKSRPNRAPAAVARIKTKEIAPISKARRPQRAGRWGRSKWLLWSLWASGAIASLLRKPI